MESKLSKADYMSLFTAENVLKDTPFLAHVLRTRDDISRSSDGNIIDYYTAVLRLKDEVDSLPRLELQTNVPSGSESAYQRQLIHALEKINEDHDRVASKLIKVKSRLMAAITMMKDQRAQFKAYFILAFPVAIHTADIPGMKMNPKDIGDVAAGEYSRMMDNLDNVAIGLISEIVLLEAKTKLSKASAAESYKQGKATVDLMWHSVQSHGAIGMDDNPGALLKKSLIEEEDGDEIPSYVSRHTKEVRFGASIKRPEDAAPAEIKGTFYKEGDPKPVTLVDEDGEIRVVSFTLPERKDPVEYPVTISESEWSPTRLLELAEEEEKAELGCPVLACSPEIYEESKAQNEEPKPVEPESVKPESVKPELDLSDSHVIGDYKLKWDLTDQPTTSSVLIEDIEDSPPHSMQEASKLMEEASIGEAVVPDFKPVTGKVLTAPELENLLNEHDPLATPAPINPRKKLVLLDEDELSCFMGAAFDIPHS